MPSESEPPGLQNNLLSPLLTGTESPFDLEQQWQDLMSIMEMQVGLQEQGTGFSDEGWGVGLGVHIQLLFHLWEKKVTLLCLIHRKVGTLRGNCLGVSLG